MQRAEASRRRGRLKIFFGASAGVGKTFGMLLAARERRAEGLDVVAGYVETHKRAETEQLLEGLEILPPRLVEYRDTQLREFDLDAALKRHPALILVDELAHTNAPGSRHPKRWQDVEELLEAGIDVYTTINVQHIESLNDVVAADHRRRACGKPCPTRCSTGRRNRTDRPSAGRAVAAAEGRQGLSAAAGAARAARIFSARAT